jgi:hypothetical protein
MLYVDEQVAGAVFTVAMKQLSAKLMAYEKGCGCRK